MDIALTIRRWFESWGWVVIAIFLFLLLIHQDLLFAQTPPL